MVLVRIDGDNLGYPLHHTVEHTGILSTRLVAVLALNRGNTLGVIRGVKHGIPIIYTIISKYP